MTLVNNWIFYCWSYLKFCLSWLPPDLAGKVQKVFLLLLLILLVLLFQLLMLLLSLQITKYVIAFLILWMRFLNKVKGVITVSFTLDKLACTDDPIGFAIEIFLIPLRAKQVGEFIVINRILSTLGCLTLYKPPIISAACHGIGPKIFLVPIGQKSMSQIFSAATHLPEMAQCLRDPVY